MQKTVNINLSGSVFYIDDDAYALLRQYLDKLENYFGNQEEGKEIIHDIESRIAELFNEKLNDKGAVVNMAMVEDVIAKMGQPEDFEEEASEEKETGSYKEEKYYKQKKRLYRDVDNRVLGGVCGGIAAYFNTDPVFVRVLFAILPFLSFGIIIPVYIVLWIIIPAAITTAQKLEMRGENVTIKNIEKAIRNEYEDVKEHFSKVRESKMYRKGESWWNRLTKRDRNIVIVIAVVVGAALLANIFQIHVFNENFVYTTNYHNGFFFNVFHGGGVMGLAIILLIIGLIFRSIFKIVIYLIAFLFIGVLAIKIIGFVMGSVIMLC
ncbi:PspC domain-containing protein [Plebeiibacterium sediminum]|uniref:PspC domain-containing protein n=1 Tax=Plebeiibacterium sediminum TaxID=2992112 RepID=A0AAE3SDS7_9BACT|nr:PspC domain-containing protein [Plebeiobacterium sediminum]MCW3785743.1 PspC domain-containing protein [Plebeiobacterium sediminum]